MLKFRPLTLGPLLVTGWPFLQCRLCWPIWPEEAYRQHSSPPCFSRSECGNQQSTRRLHTTYITTCFNLSICGSQLPIYLQVWLNVYSLCWCATATTVSHRTVSLLKPTHWRYILSPRVNNHLLTDTRNLASRCHIRNVKSMGGWIIRGLYC